MEVYILQGHISHGIEKLAATVHHWLLPVCRLSLFFIGLPFDCKQSHEIRNMGSPLWIMLTGRGLLLLYQILKIKFASPADFCIKETLKRNSHYETKIPIGVAKELKSTEESRFSSFVASC